MSKKFAFLAVGAALAVASIAALAQTIAIPTVTNIGTSDLVKIIPGGVPNAQDKYATPQQIAGAPGYKVLYSGASAAGQTLTYTQTNGVTYVFAYSSGSAITSVTITTDANPSDGERLCYLGDGAATTTLTFTANTGQTIVPTITAGVSDVAICLTYNAATTKWFRS